MSGADNTDTPPATPPKGHNRAGGISADQLRTIVQRIENLEEEKRAITADIADVLAEAKGNGFCTKTIRKVIKLRKLDAAEREEDETVQQIYMRALGMLPLEEAAEDT